MNIADNSWSSSECKKVQMVVCFSKIHGNSLLLTESTCQLISIGFHGYTNNKHIISTGLLFLTFLFNISHTHITKVNPYEDYVGRQIDIYTLELAPIQSPSLLPPSHPPIHSSIHPSLSSSFIHPSTHPSIPLFLPSFSFLCWGWNPGPCVHIRQMLCHQATPLSYLSSLCVLPLSHASRGQKIETGTVNG